jgi:hypothetical protein
MELTMLKPIRRIALFSYLKKCVATALLQGKSEQLFRRNITQLFRIVAIFTHFVKQRGFKRPLSIKALFNEKMLDYDVDNQAFVYFIPPQYFM